MNYFPAHLPFEPLTALLVIPAVTAGVLTLLRNYWIAARVNMLATFLTLIVAVSLLFERPQSGGYLFGRTFFRRKTKPGPRGHAVIVVTEPALRFFEHWI